MDWNTINNKRKPFIRMGERLYGAMFRDIRRSLITEIAKVVGEEDVDTVQLLLDVVKSREYTYLQTEALAYAYKHAETPELKEAVLHTGVGKNDTWEDVLHKARFERAVQDRFPQTFTFTPEWERELMRDEQTHTYVRKFYGAINSARRHILLGPLFVEQEIYTPDQARYTEQKIDATIQELNQYKQVLQKVK